MSMIAAAMVTSMQKKQRITTKCDWKEGDMGKKIGERRGKKEDVWKKRERKIY